MDEIHLGQVLHSTGDITQHLDEIVDVETPRVKTKKRIERAVIHVLSNDHERIGLCDHALETNDILVMKLSHDARLGQEIAAVLFGRAHFECLDGHGCPTATAITSGGSRRRLSLELALAHVAKLTTTDHRLDFDVERRDLLSELLNRQRRVFVRVRIDVVEFTVSLMMSMMMMVMMVVTFDTTDDLRRRRGRARGRRRCRGHSR